MSRKSFFYAGLVLLLFAGSLIIVNPSGNFPLNDDWVYAHSVQSLVSGSGLEIHEWAVASLVFQAFWGYLFASLAGFSYQVLRISTFVMYMLGAIFFYLTLIELRIEPTRSFMGAVLLVFNPIAYVLSFSFMTDIHFMSLMIIAVYFFIAGYSRQNMVFTLAGSVAAAACILVRQTGIFIPLGLILFYYVNRKEALKRAVLAALFPMMVFLLYYWWFNHISGSNWAQQVIASADIREHLYHPLDIISGFPGPILWTLSYMGLSIAPLAFSGKRGKKKLNLWAILILTAVAVFLMLKGPYLGGGAPASGNYLNLKGLGVVTLHGWSAKSGGFFENRLFIFILATAGFLGLIRFFKGARMLRGAGAVYFFIAGIMLISLAAGPYFLDRYAIVAVPAFIALYLVSCRKISALRFYLLFAVFAAVSVVAANDYMAWNRAKWDLSRKAQKHGIRPEEIAAGFDHDGYYTFAGNMKRLKRRKPLSEIGKWEWQELNPYRYMITAKPAGSKVVGEEEYRSLLSGRSRIYLISI